MGPEIIFFVAILIVSVVVHEVSHGYMAYILGDSTAKHAGRLTLNPISHLDPLGSVVIPFITSILGMPFGWAKPVPFNPYNLSAGKWGPALVAFAGPGSNLLIVAFFTLILRATPFFGLSAGVLELVSLIVLVNLWLAAFNLIPVPPLDGSKILFALIPYRYRNVEQIMEKYQLALILIAILFISNLVSPVVMWVFNWLTGVGV
ncbi:MAG: hypothetical protein QG665_454 [Patescibacteria group bacterium]|nr:hypothetical protein [Patescibacteria group bacterium]